MLASRPLASIVIASIAGLGCSSTKTTSAELHGVKYQFPAGHVSTAVSPSEGTLYVRLAPPGANFHLVLDELADHPSNYEDIPVISRLTDIRFREFEITSTKAGKVYCLVGPRPHFNCGMHFRDGPVNWAILFDRRFVEDAPEIWAQTNALIRSYRSQ
jgi:hypothetical protein